MTELVTCIVPVRDGARHLPAALDSILAQTHQALDVLVVDDGSQDGSGDIARRYGDPVRVLVSDRPGGPAAARTTGVAASRADWVAFLDADDLWRPDKLAVQLEHLAGPPRLDVSLAEVENFWERGHEAEERRWRAHGRVRGSGVFSAVAARRTTFELVPIPDRRHNDLAAWILQVRAAGLAVGRLDRVLSDRRRHGANMSEDLDEAYEEWFSLLRERVADHRARSA